MYQTNPMSKKKKQPIPKFFCKSCQQRDCNGMCQTLHRRVEDENRCFNHSNYLNQFRKQLGVI